MKFTVKELKKEVMKVKKKFKVSKLNHKYYITRYITNLLNELDEKAVGTQTPQFVHEKYTDVTIQKDKSKRYGKLSEEQEMMLQEYENNNYKILVSNDYDEIIKEIILYFQGVRIKCKHCSRKFKSSETLSNHLKFIHKHL